MSGYLLAAAGLLFFLAVLLAVWERRRTARTMGRLEKMLDAAMNGHFSEDSFDETRLSALESSLARCLTASRQSAKSIQAQRDQISTLISDISHQTRTPVSNLQLYAQLLQEQPLPPQALSCVQAIAVQSQKLQTLIESLVRTSRLETGILALHPQKAPIAPMVERAAAQYVPKAEEKGLTLRLESLEGQGVFDPKWTEEALCNLLDNAVKYTPAGGTVSVTVQNFELFSAIRVSDTGPGISEAQQANIFGRFYRGPGVYQAEGVGIGLYLTRQILEQEGGYVKVESTPGKGSIFSLFLPRE